MRDKPALATIHFKQRLFCNDHLRVNALQLNGFRR
jgi:hypothetical protein